MSSILCIGLVSAALVHPLPATAVTLRWMHSVERVPWEEDYRVVGEGLALTEARVKRSGAGMDPPAGAVWRDGWWKYRPAQDLLPEVVLANSQFVGGYILCWDGGGCQPLERFVPKGRRVTLKAMPCAA